MWSKIDDLYLYHAVQNEIREKLGGENILPQEFPIWQQEKEATEKREFIASAKRIVKHENCPESLRCELNLFIKEQEEFNRYPHQTRRGLALTSLGFDVVYVPG